jgi:fumarate reductase flavoprotein subunit
MFSDKQLSADFPEEDDSPPFDPNPSGEPGSVPEGVPRVKYSFETPPDPVPEEDIRETVTAGVVVVGGGLAGTSAALEAAAAGADTVLIEMMPRCQARGRDNAFIGSRLQRQLGIEIDASEVCLELMKYSANKPDQRLLRMWANDGGATADWLLDITDAAGLKVSIADYPPPAVYNPADNYYPQYLVTHRYENETLVMRCLWEQTVKHGVNFHFRTRARQLLRPGNGRVTGVVAQNPAGDYIRYLAKQAVILCTGDYSYNREMMAKYCPQAAYQKTRVKTATGDGHMMAMWIGAVMEPGPHAHISHGFPGPLGCDAFLQVNLKGERFQNEDIPGQSYTNQIERQPGRTAWQVYDAKYPEEVQYMGIGLGNVTDLNESGGFARSPDVTADTLEELAEKMELPVDIFTATVARYNELARLGKDLDFGKRPDRLTTIEKPPFYAGKGFYGLLTVMGGLNLNTRMQALDRDWEVIPGLYLAGNTMGNRFAVDYPTLAPGLSHGMALHFGRVAGKNAATVES